MSCGPLQESTDHHVSQSQLAHCGYSSEGQPLAPHLSTDGNLGEQLLILVWLLTVIS